MKRLLTKLICFFKGHVEVNKDGWRYVVACYNPDGNGISYQCYRCGANLPAEDFVAKKDGYSILAIKQKRK